MNTKPNKLEANQKFANDQYALALQDDHQNDSEDINEIIEVTDDDEIISDMSTQDKIALSLILQEELIGIFFSLYRTKKNY